MIEGFHRRQTDVSMMKRIHERLLLDTIPAGLRRWLLANPANRHLIEPAPAIKGEDGPPGPRIKAGKIETFEELKEAILNGCPINMVQQVMFR